jgi:hypothetical protein
MDYGGDGVQAEDHEEVARPMGEICEEASGRVCVLEAHHLIGRSNRCALQLAEPSVSGEHASLRWTGAAWVVKDLGSRYGTFLNGEPLQPGVPSEVPKEARMAFGRERRTWMMTNDSAPQVMVVPAAGGAALFQRDGMIAIPSVERPIGVVYQDKDAHWVLDQNGSIDVIQEKVPFSVDGTLWRLCNTSLLQPTSVAGEGRESMSLDEVRLHFRVSRNEEHVQLIAHWGERPIDFGARAYHYSLLTLARARLRDQEAGVPAASAGWMDQDELLDLLHVGPEKLALDTFRVRRQFSAAGFVHATAIVERRPATKELRIGVSNITIEVV